MEQSLDQIQNIPKYYQLKQIILKGITNGEYPLNAKLPTEKELMNKYNVSYITVYKAKLELMKEGFIYAIQGKGAFVSDRANKGEQQQKMISGKRLSFMSSFSTDDPFFHRILTGIVNSAQSAGYKVEVNNSNYDAVTENNLLSNHIQEPPSGLIISISMFKGHNHIIQLSKMGVPVVLVFDDIKGYGFDWIGANQTKSVKKVVKYLIDKGHKRIAYLGNVLVPPEEEVRHEAYKIALKQNRIKYDENLYISKGNIITPDQDGGYSMMSCFLENGSRDFTAVVAWNDKMAVGAYKALKEKGLNVPGDVSLIGFDNLEIAANNEVPLTTVDNNAVEVGEKAVELLIRRIEEKSSGSLVNAGPEKIQVRTKLVIRDSVKDISGK